MLEVMSINAIGPALLLKHFSKKLDRESLSIFVNLSARVGSIEDNKLGGWITYRASKAALNQIIKTASIEIQRNTSLSYSLLNSISFELLLKKMFSKLTKNSIHKKLS